MVINRYIFREVLFTLLAVAVVLMLIFLSSNFVRYLADVATGGLPADIVFSLVGYKAIELLMLVLPLSFYIAILLTLGRLYKDSEMAALAACGVGPGSILKGILLVAPLVALIVGFLSFYAAPYAAGMKFDLRERAEQESELSMLAAGKFRESRNGDRIFYVESLSSDKKTMQNIFVQSREHGKLSVLSSSNGQRIVDNKTGDQYMVMIDGYRYEGTPGEVDYKIIKFEKHAVRIEEKEFTPVRRKQDAVSTAELWGSDAPRDRAELQWRMSMPVTTLLLAMLALPLSRTSPREGRFARLFVAVLVYVIYNNMMGVAKDLVKQEAVPDLVGMWWVHAVLLAITVFLLLQQSGFRWLYLRATGRLPAI